MQHRSLMKYLSILLALAVLLGCEHDRDDDVVGDHGGLVAYFPLDSTYADESGNGVLLQVFGAPEFTEGSGGAPFSAVLLDGEDDYLVATVGTLDTFSISMWVRSYRYFVGEWPHWRSTVFDYSDKQVYGYIDGVSGATRLSFGIDAEPVTGIIPDNMYHWFHLYVAVDHEVNIYYNGSLSSTVSVEEARDYLSEFLYLGRASADEDLDLTYFYGPLDEIRIFNRVLDQTEIDKLFTGQ
jgi:hypothetical protein